MASQVWAALTAAIASILLAIGTTTWAWRQQHTKRARKARTQLDRYREPLLSAVDDLGNRIDNIRRRKFYRYLSADRRTLARLSTAYRFAQFLGWMEVLYASSGHLHLTEDRKTRGIASLTGWAGATLAVDAWDRTDKRNITTARLMLWREEQRAIGELMRTAGDVPSLIGYSTFSARYATDFAPWFDRFLDDLDTWTPPSGTRPPDTNDSVRLNRLQAILACLLVRLDVNHSVVGRDKNGHALPTWISNDRFAPLPGAEFSLPNGSPRAATARAAGTATPDGPAAPGRGRARRLLPRRIPSPRGSEDAAR